MLFSKWSIVIKLPVKRTPWFGVYNWQIAKCEYKQYCDVFCGTYLKRKGRSV